jgi:hypothetical protein
MPGTQASEGSGPHFTSTEWDDALRQVTAVDRDRVDQLLRRGFDS